MRHAYVETSLSAQSKVEKSSDKSSQLFAFLVFYQVNKKQSEVRSPVFTFEQKS